MSHQCHKMLSMGLSVEAEAGRLGRIFESGHGITWFKAGICFEQRFVEGLNLGSDP